MESKKYNKLVNATQKQQTHRYREQTGGYQKGGGWGMDEIGEVEEFLSWLSG